MRGGSGGFLGADKGRFSIKDLFGRYYRKLFIQKAFFEVVVGCFNGTFSIRG